MNDDVQASLTQTLERLVATYRELAEAHRAFLAGPPTADRLTPLLDQREVSFAESRDLETDLAVTLAATAAPSGPPASAAKGGEGPETRPAAPPTTLASLAAAVERALPGGPALVADLRQALTEVVDTDRQIQAVLETSRAALDGEIKKIRRGANLLKGYLQPDDTGSCFIDKVK